MCERQQRLLGVQVVRSGDDGDIGPSCFEQGRKIVAASGVGVELALLVELVRLRIDQCGDLAAAIPGGYLGYVAAGAAAVECCRFSLREWLRQASRRTCSGSAGTSAVVQARRTRTYAGRCSQAELYSLGL